MARKLDDIFNECYERIRSGESLKSCLARYPEHCAELESLLKTVFDIGRRASYIHPRPEFKHWARVRFEGAQHYAKQHRQAEKPSSFSWWRQSWTVAATAVIILLLTSGSTMAASSNSLPDEPLYPIKLATEEVRLAFAFSEESKVELHTQLAETRAVEVEVMANEGKTEHAAITAARLAKQLELANAAITNVESTGGTAPLPAATPEPTVTEPVPPSTPETPPTPSEEVPAVPPQSTEEQPPTTAEQPPTTTEQPPTTAEQPPTTEVPQTPPEAAPVVPPTLTDNKTTPAVPPTPPADTTQKKWTEKRERIKEALDKSTSKSLTALENAKDKASQQSKADWQRAIDSIEDKSKEKQSDKDKGKTWGGSKSDNKTWGGNKSDNKTWGGWSPNTVSPNQSQPYPSK